MCYLWPWAREIESPLGGEDGEAWAMSRGGSAARVCLTDCDLNISS